MIKNLTDLTVRPDASLLDTIAAISKGTKQIALVIDDAGVLLGTVTDGDIRRGLLRGLDMKALVTEVMNPNPTTASLGDDAQTVMVEQLARMKLFVDEGLHLVEDYLKKKGLHPYLIRHIEQFGGNRNG